jgi:hypothetical protein
VKRSGGSIRWKRRNVRQDGNEAQLPLRSYHQLQELFPASAGFFRQGGSMDSLEFMEKLRSQLYVEGAGEREQYETLLTIFAGTPYAWGGSTPSGSDCSGSVCCVLNTIYGTKIRVTADTLFRKYFIRRGGYGSGITALFFLDKEGKAVHVAGSLGDEAFMNVSSREPAECGMARTREEMEILYHDLRMTERSLDTGVWR